MSTQLKAQQGLTNLTPIKVIHILISLAIMVCFKFVPAAEPLTPLGVEVIGIFLGMLYGWLIANDSFWPSIFGLLFLGLSSYSTVPAVLRDGFGNSTVLLLFFFFTSFFSDNPEFFELFFKNINGEFASHRTESANVI